MTKPITELIAELKQLGAKAQVTPWRIEDYELLSADRYVMGIHSYEHVRGALDWPVIVANRDLICAAVNHLPTLIAAYEERCAEVALLQREMAGAIDNEQERWQNAIDELFARLIPDADIDGGGCDSGDPLDFSISEIGQALSYVERTLTGQLDAARKALEKMESDDMLGCDDDREYAFTACECAGCLGRKALTALTSNPPTNEG